MAPGPLVINFENKEDSKSKLEFGTPRTGIDKTKTRNWPPSSLNQPQSQCYIVLILHFIFPSAGVRHVVNLRKKFGYTFFLNNRWMALCMWLLFLEDISSFSFSPPAPNFLMLHQLQYSQEGFNKSEKKIFKKN